MFFSFSRKQALVLAGVIFLLTQLIGLYTAASYSYYIKSGELEPVFSNPQDAFNSIVLVFYLLIMTGVIVLVLKFKPKLIVFLEAVAIFFASAIVFDFVFPVPFVGEILAFILVFLKLKKKSFFYQNLAMMFAVAGAGSVIGVSLQVLPAIILLFILSVYDFIAVFVTKHMVFMAEKLGGRTAFTAAIPCKEVNHVFQVGGGDLAMPLVLSSSLLVNLGLVPALSSVTGSLIGLLFLFYYVSRKPGRVMPALPVVSAGACLGFFISTVL